jgi:hypothetical protein
LHLTCFLVGAACGAAFMFLTDPLAGRRRRRFFGDKFRSTLRHGREILIGYGTHVGQHARGAAHEWRAWATEGDVPDHTLVERVRAQLGRGVSHVRQICVSAHDGVVTLAGSALRHESANLLENVQRVRGVKSVARRLHLYDTPEEFPVIHPVPGGSIEDISRQTPSVPSSSAGR